MTAPDRPSVTDNARAWETTRCACGHSFDPHDLGLTLTERIEIYAIHVAEVRRMAAGRAETTTTLPRPDDARAEAIEAAARWLDRIYPNGLVAKKSVLADLAEWSDRAKRGVQPSGREWATARAETTTDNFGDAYMLGYSAAKNAETTTATTEDIDRLAHSKDVRVYGDYGAGWRDGVKAAAGLLARPTPTRDQIVAAIGDAANSTQIGFGVVSINAATDAVLALLEGGTDE